MTQFPELWNALADHFDERLVRTRPAGGGRQVPYITARTVMNRLDSTLGFENWWDTYERDPAGSDNILCRLSIRLPDGQVLTKCDVGSPGSTGDEGEDDKGAVSDALKRAAVKFGVGRYLYGDGVYLCPRGEASVESRAVEPPPPAPAPVPAASNGHRRDGAASQARQPASEAQRRYGSAREPGANGVTGKWLFGWAKDQFEAFGIDVLKYLANWGKLQEYPGRIVDWNVNQAELGHAEALRKFPQLTAGAAEPEEALAN